MKVQESLAQYLYETKKLTLPGIGHFTLDPSVNVYEKNDAATLQHAIQFTYDTKETEDAELVAHLVKTTGKMKPLAMSDLESFLSTGKQLLNIGKPFIIPGIGSLSKTRDTIEYAAGNITPAKPEEKPTEHKFRDKTVEEPNFSSVEKEFEYEPGSRRTSRRWLIMLATFLLLAIAGWGVYYFVFSGKTKEAGTQINNETSEAQDSVTQQSADTGALKPVDSPLLKKPSIAAIPDSINYDYAVELREYTYLKSANARMAELRSYRHKVFLETKDSTHYALLLPVSGLLSDSTRVIDSLSRMLLMPGAKRPTVRLKQ